MAQQKVVLLTGASRGIGLAIAQHLLQHTTSPNLILIARTAQPLEHLASQYPNRVKFLTGDFSDPALPQRAITLATETYNRLDALILNHGTLDPVAKLSDSDIETWRSSFEVNFFSIVSLIQLSLPLLRQAGSARVILTSSGAAANAYQGWAAYGASKAALNHLAMSLAKEEPNVVAIAVRPGVVDTQMQVEIRERHGGVMDVTDARKFAELKSSGGLLRPEQPGNVIARLALDAPKSLSGKFVNWNAEELRDFQD